MTKQALLMIALLPVLPVLPATAAPCPDEPAGETPADCPWADIARRVSAGTGKLGTLAPGLLARIRKDAKLKSWKQLWGRSVNYDELAKATIVEHPILHELEKAFGLPESDGRTVHAGLEHTYGYLFSTLKTPFGYKRARWVQGELENGFGLPAGLLGPEPGKGSLFSNVTYFAGRIAFRNDSQELETLARKASAVPGELRGFRYSALKLTRLEETDDAAATSLRTDFAEFPAGPSKSGNSHLLIYSTSSGKGARARAQLITAFPVSASFVGTALLPERLGERQPIVTRYNAFVDGLTGQRRTGMRRIVK